MNQLLQSSQPYLPFLVICAIALTVVALFLVFMAGRRLMAKSARRAALAPPPGISEYDHQYKKETQKHFWSRWFKKRPKKDSNTLHSTTSMSQGFKKTLQMFKDYFGGTKAKYDQPWYLLIGPSGSGKSTLLKDLDLELPLGKPQESDFDHEDIDWWYFERGIVLDVRGDFILEKTGQNSQDSSWDLLLKNLEKSRPERPLDGIILTVSAAELVGPHRLDEDSLKDRSRIIFNKLWKLQKSLGIKVPVYVIVTKTDLVPNFESFSKEIPAQSTQEMFGWSCPYTLDTSFSTIWINEIFNSVQHVLDKIRLGIFAHGQVQKERDGVMLFPSHFKSLKENLANYLVHIFKESSYKESFFLRGVYFSGYGLSETPKENVPFSLSTSFDKTIKHIDYNEKLDKRVIFIQDLFTNKIFRESHLAQPIPRILTHQRKILKTLTWSSASVATLWTLGICYNYKTLKDESSHLFPSLNVIHHSLKGINERGGKSDDPALLGYLNRESEKLLSAFSMVDSINTQTFFMPTSWFGSMDDYIQDSFTAAYDRIILPSIYAGLTHRGQQLTHVKSLAPKKNLGGFFNPLESDSFAHLNRFVNALYEFEDFVKRYNKLEKTQSVEDLGILVNYLFHHQLPSHFYKNNSYYKKALSKTLERTIDLSAYKVSIGQKLGMFFKHFLDEAFDLKKSYPALVMLQRNLEGFSNITNARTLNDNNVRQTLDAAIAVADMMTSGQMSWLTTRTFNPGDMYEMMLSHIYDMKLFGPDISQELMRVADHDFVRFKIELSELRSSLTGPFFQIQEGQFSSDPPGGLITLIDSLSALLDEPFMIPMDRYDLTLKVPGGKILFWDDVPLLKAGDMVDAYMQFTTQKLGALPHHLQPIFKVIARHTVRQKVTSLVAQGQTFHDSPSLYDGFNIREVTHSQVTNVATVTPHFSKILGVFQDEGFVDHNAKLREILVEQNYDILERIERLLQQDNPYNADNEDLLIRWNGEDMLGLSLFGVHSIAEMKNYLSAQRGRIGFLAKELAEPILTIISLGYDGHSTQPKGLPLIDKWVQIIKDLQQYDTQSMTNNVKILEDFLTYKLNELSIDDSCSIDDMDTDGFGEHDYFLAIRDRYYTMLSSRCELLMGYQSIERFNQAALFFNQHLSQRYPFTSTSDTPEKIEADPEDVQTFFELYDALTETDRNLLIKAANKRGAPKTVGDFIHQIDSVRPLLLASLDKGMKKHIPGLKVDVSFRTDQNREIGGNKIIDWSFDFGDHRIDGRDPELKGFWQVGSPIDVALRWAGDADVVPIPDPRSTFLHVSGPVATYSYRGRWSLIRLIRQHATPDSTFDSSDTPDPQTLEFYIPTAFSPACYQGQPPRLTDRKSEPARVYCQLTLNLPDSFDATKAKDTKKRGVTPVKSKKENTLPVPRFPQNAPLVDAFETALLKNNKRLRRLP